MRAKTLATLTLITLLVGCGDDPPGSIIQPDAAGETGADGEVPDGAPPPPPPDGMVQADASDDAPPPPPDAPVVETGVDVVDTDTPAPPDAGPPDVIVDMDVPVGMDVPMGMDVPPPPDADGPDAVVTPDASEPDVIVPPDMPMTGLAGHRATALVANGAVMRSPSYRMVSTLGQSSIHQTVMRSLGFRLRGGLVGATGGSR